MKNSLCIESLSRVSDVCMNKVRIPGDGFPVTPYLGQLLCRKHIHGVKCCTEGEMLKKEVKCCRNGVKCCTKGGEILQKWGEMLHKLVECFTKGGQTLPPSPAALSAQKFGFQCHEEFPSSGWSPHLQHSNTKLSCSPAFSIFILIFFTLTRQAWEQNNGEMDLITLGAWKRFLIAFGPVYP